MDTETNYTLGDLVNAAIEQKPTDFEQAFNDLIVDRIRDSIEAKKVEIARTIYGYEAEPESEQPDDSQEEE